MKTTGENIAVHHSLANYFQTKGLYFNYKKSLYYVRERKTSTTL